MEGKEPAAWPCSLAAGIRDQMLAEQVNHFFCTRAPGWGLASTSFPLLLPPSALCSLHGLLVTCKELDLTVSDNDIFLLPLQTVPTFLCQPHASLPCWPPPCLAWAVSKPPNPAPLPCISPISSEPLPCPPSSPARSHPPGTLHAPAPFAWGSIHSPSHDGLVSFVMLWLQGYLCRPSCPGDSCPFH